MYAGNHDQTPRFVDEGIWENGHTDKYLDDVKSIEVGDRIAIKAAYVRKKNLPFDNRGLNVSTMTVKAIGTVTQNLGDGRMLEVEWTLLDNPREWYFFTFRPTVSKVQPGDWRTDALIAFAFDGQPQDISRFRNDPYWSDRFGDESSTEPNTDNEILDSVNSENGGTSEFSDGIKSQGANGPSVHPYSIDDIINDGCFIDPAKLDAVLARLRTKKNLILQGPPGTGKSWLAKRLGFALMGAQDPQRLRAVQFHPNLSYEDFVRGHRPASGGKLDLVDGPFLNMIAVARSLPNMPHVFVIEEINRGNPAQIFGEMLTLLEADKRKPDEALELCYPREKGERIYIPDNLFVIGTMNIADRSIAPLDMALRRRFAFIDLEPSFGQRWRDWVRDKSNAPAGVLEDIEKRLQTLNDEIAKDRKLGRHFCIGHSFVTPHEAVDDALDWFRQIVETEIGPVLDEYWFDDLEQARKAKERLLKGS